MIGEGLPSAILSVWGTSTSDVYAVGGDRGDGTGPLVLHFDGTAWSQLATGENGNLWWVFGIGGAVYMGGEGGMILRYQQGAFTRMSTPSTTTVFGIWGTAADDLWAVGGASGGGDGGFAWRLQGGVWVAAPGFPADIAATGAIWKMSGRSADDAWMVGTNGKVVRWDGAVLTAMTTGTGESLFTVHATADRFVAVGGFGTGTILENEGSGWNDVSPPIAPALIGTYLSGDAGYAVGQDGAVFERNRGGWSEVDLGVPIEQSFHSVWIDPSGGVWAVGGQVQTLPLIDGIMLYGGDDPPDYLP